MDSLRYTLFMLIMLPAIFARYYNRLQAIRAVLEATEVCTNKPADIVFILDESSSIWLMDYYKQVDFVLDLTDTFQIDSGDIKVGLLSFSNISRVRFELGEVTSMAEMHQVMAGIKKTQMAGDMTLTYNAIDLMVSDMFSAQFARPGVAHICILITDGESSDFDKTAAAAAAARAAGITMFAIGVGKNLKRELNAIASDPDDEYVFTVDNYDALQNIANQVVQRTCIIITPPPTTPPPSIEGCDERGLVDMVFALPDQAGIQGMAHSTEFVSHLVSKVNLDVVKVGVTPRYCVTAEPIALYEHDNFDSFNNALSLRNINAAFTDKHLEYIIEEGMNPQNGAREDSMKFAVLIVDGPFASSEEAQLQAALAKNAGIELIVIGVGNVNKAELLGVASSTDHIFTVSDYSQLKSITGDLVKRFCIGMAYDNEAGDYDNNY